MSIAALLNVFREVEDLVRTVLMASPCPDGARDDAACDERLSSWASVVAVVSTAPPCGVTSCVVHLVLVWRVYFMKTSAGGAGAGMG